MGEEYDERNPFPFFTDHVDPVVAEATRAGRKREVLRSTGTPGPQPDPQDEQTFERSTLEPCDTDGFFRELLALRSKLPRELDVAADGNRVIMRRGEARLALDFDAKTAELSR
jgi:maltooligosyltrehalose trehalohydrolase